MAGENEVRPRRTGHSGEVSVGFRPHCGPSAYFCRDPKLAILTVPGYWLDRAGREQAAVSYSTKKPDNIMKQTIRT